jgi:hypothetical protein
MSEAISLTPIPNPIRKDRKLDVIFVHGLGDNDIHAWQYGNDRNLFWPSWLAEDIPSIQVWLLRYGAAKFWFQSVALALPDRAVSVLSYLIDNQLGARDLVFVTHSLGGLVVKLGLQISETSEDPRLKPIGKATRGVVFLATPHTGSSIAGVASRLGIASKATAGLSMDDPWLRLLNDWYRSNAPKFGWKTRPFCETIPTRLSLVVSNSSADPHVENVTCVPVDADHSGICKLASRESPIYNAVMTLIGECLTTQRPARTAELEPHFLDVVVANPQNVPANVLTYVASRPPGGTLVIKPSLDYLNILAEGSAIRSLDYDWLPFELSSPQLDVKIINQGLTPLLLTGAIFDVEESVPDLRPIPVLKREGTGMHLPLRNLGWGAMQDCQLIFEIMPEGQQLSGEISLPFTRSLGTVEMFPKTSDLDDAFRERGVNVEKLRKMRFRSSDQPMSSDDQRRLAAMPPDERAELLRELFGPFKEGAAVVAGYVIYNWLDHKSEQHDERVPFVCRVLLTYPGQRKPLPPSSTYEVKFEVERQNYQIRVPVSQLIETGEADRFLIKIDADRSSFHGFQLSFSSNRGVLKCGPTVLDYFRPRNEIDYVGATPQGRGTAL